MTESVQPGGMAGLAGLVVQADDEVVAGAGGGDVEEAQLLLLVHRRLRGFRLLEARCQEAPFPRADTHLRPPSASHRTVALPRVRGPVVDVQADQRYDGELQPLGGVDGHYADGVVVGLGDDRLDDPRSLLRLQLRPVDELTQGAAAGLGEGARLVEDEAEPLPALPRPPVGEGELEESPLADDRLDDPV